LYTSIELRSDPPVSFPLTEGMEVIYRSDVEATEPCNTWFRIRDPDGRLLMAGVDAISLAPFDEEPYVWYAPLSVRAVDELCPTESADCYGNERLAIEATYGDEIARVFDGQVGTVGRDEAYQLTVETASRRNNIHCENTPVEWYKALITYIPD